MQVVVFANHSLCGPGYGVGWYHICRRDPWHKYRQKEYNVKLTVISNDGCVIPPDTYPYQGIQEGEIKLDLQMESVRTNQRWKDPAV
jgi:hypothetical protein